MKNFKYLSMALIIAVFGSNFSFAKEKGDLIVRMRALYVNVDGDSTVSTLGGEVAASSDQVPEIDFSYFLSKNIAAELILGTTEHDISLQGSPALNQDRGLGSVKLLPPTLTLQYHFNPEGDFRPYAGAGLNYTIFYGEKIGDLATSMEYKNNFGYAVQVGFDYMIDDKIGFNFDIKKIYLSTDVKVNNSVDAKVDLDPWLIGAGLSYHF